MSLCSSCRSFLYPNVVGMGITDDTRADRMQTWTRLSFASLSFRVVIVCWWIGFLGESAAYVVICSVRSAKHVHL